MWMLILNIIIFFIKLKNHYKIKKIIKYFLNKYADL
jgi:hypothetical protein